MQTRVGPPTSLLDSTLQTHSRQEYSKVFIQLFHRVQMGNFIQIDVCLYSGGGGGAMDSPLLFRRPKNSYMFFDLY